MKKSLSFLTTLIILTIAGTNVAGCNNISSLKKDIAKDYQHELAKETKLLKQQFSVEITTLKDKISNLENQISHINNLLDEVAPEVNALKRKITNLKNDSPALEQYYEKLREETKNEPIIVNNINNDRYKNLKTMNEKILQAITDYQSELKTRITTLKKEANDRQNILDQFNEMFKLFGAEGEFKALDKMDGSASWEAKINYLKEQFKQLIAKDKAYEKEISDAEQAIDKLSDKAQEAIDKANEILKK